MWCGVGLVGTRLTRWLGRYVLLESGLDIRYRHNGRDCEIDLIDW